MCLALDELREEVREEGMEIGRQEGRQEGMELGRQEGCEASKYNLASKMLANHEPIDKIQEYTDYTREKIKDIEKELFINELISVGTLVIYFRTEP